MYHPLKTVGNCVTYLKLLITYAITLQELLSLNLIIHTPQGPYCYILPLIYTRLGS